MAEWQRIAYAGSSFSKCCLRWMNGGGPFASTLLSVYTSPWWARRMTVLCPKEHLDYSNTGTKSICSVRVSNCALCCSLCCAWSHATITIQMDSDLHKLWVIFLSSKQPWVEVIKGMFLQIWILENDKARLLWILIVSKIIHYLFVNFKRQTKWSVCWIVWDYLVDFQQALSRSQKVVFFFVIS